MEILDAPESFEIKVPIRKYWIPMFISGIMAIVSGAFTILIIMLLVKHEGNLPFPKEIYVHLFLFPIFLNLAMWFIFGYEKITFNRDKLEVIKSNKIFSRRRVFNLCEINSIEIRKKKSNVIERVHYIREMRRAMFFWRRMGKIIIKMTHSKSTILNGLQENEIIKMKKIIEKEIEQRCS